MPTWSAEIVVDGRLARRLLTQFEELDVQSLEPFSEGWDRTVWLVNERWVFGFPRRAVVVPGIEREIERLPRLAPLLPLPITCPSFVGAPSHDFPWPFFGSELLPGVELCGTDLDEAGRTNVAVELAAFLARLHSDDVAQAIDAESLPPDANRRADMNLRVPKARYSLGEVERLGLWRPPSSLRQLLDEAEQLPASVEPAVVTHGDLHFRHLLVDRGRVSGVIDWVDLCRADPAIDLVLPWSSFPPPARNAFLDAYGHVTDEQLLRARVIALSLCAVLALYGHAERMPSVEREALVSLDRVGAGQG